MAFTVTIPNLAGSPSLTALTLSGQLSAASADITGDVSAATVTLSAGEDALAIDTKMIGALAQVSGIGAGFNIFTPTADCTYQLVVRGQDAATGAPTNAFLDLVEITATGAGWAPVATAVNTFGAPGARTYTNNAGALKVVIPTGTTWYIDVVVIRFPA